MNSYSIIAWFNSGCRLFYALSALHNYYIIGADATNAYAEAPPPVAQLYVKVDKPYREWYLKKYGKLIPDGYVLPVKHALQGHPESARLWSSHIHDILVEKYNFESCPHEPCLYSGTFQNQHVYFLRQVDDFAISSKYKSTIHDLLNDIDSKYLSQPLKKLGLLDSFNGIDILQTQHFIKISCSRYIKKILQGHNWDNETSIPVTSPMSYNHKLVSELATKRGPIDIKEASKLQHKMGFRYRQAIGELMFAAITCRPDIMYATIFLSQSSTHPAACHYQAVKRIFRYLRSTINHGIHYWRTSPLQNLPLHPDPTIAPDSHPIKLPQFTADEPYGFSDADWATNPKTRRSVSGISVFLAGGPVYYKSKLQPTVALSSTESELYAASEAGKAILYLRSVLKSLGTTLTSPTKLFIDNQATIAIIGNNKATRRLRHVDLRHFAIMQWVQLKNLSLHFISTEDNPSDSLTKSLRPQLHDRHAATQLGMRRPHFCKF